MATLTIRMPEPQADVAATEREAVYTAACDQLKKAFDAAYPDIRHKPNMGWELRTVPKGRVSANPTTPAKIRKIPQTA